MTGLRTWAEGVLEAAALVALACAPLLVNMYSASIFERDKAAMLVALGVVAAIALLVVAGERGLAGARRAIRQPLALAVAAVVATTLIAAAYSPDGRIAWLGSYDRAQGVTSLLAALALFAAVAWRARHSDARWRIAAGAVAASAPVALVALAQAVGASPYPGDAGSTSRVFGTLSNPIFLGAYMMLTILLGAAMFARCISEGRRGVAAGIGAVLLLDFLALAASDSRGPFLGLAFGLGVFAAAAFASTGRRKHAMAVLALAVTGLAVLYVFNMPNSIIGGFRVLPVVGRLGRITQTEAGSQRTRVAIWESTMAVVQATPAKDPIRVVIGHGPESLKYELLPYAGVRMGGTAAQANSLADRAHNTLLDDIVMTGLAGAVARVLLLTTWFATAASAAGLGMARRARAVLYGLPLAGFTIAGVSALVARPAYAAAAAMLGLAAGMLVAAALTGSHDDDRADGESTESGPESAHSAARSVTRAPARWLPLGLAAAAAATAVEGAFGIRTVAPELVTWVLLGLTLACTSPKSASAVSVAAVQRPPSRIRPPAGQATSSEITLRWDRAAAGLGAAFGAAGAVGVYSFLSAPAGVRPAEAAPVVIALLAVALAASALAAAAARASAAVAGSTALAVLLGFLALRATVLGARVPQDLFGAYVWALLALVLLSGWWLRTRTEGARVPAVRGPWAVGYALVAAVAVALVQLAAVTPVKADVLFQSALAGFAAALQTDDTAAFQQGQNTFDRVVAMAPHEARYFLIWGEMYAVLGERALPDADGAAAAFSRAQDYAARAEAAEPRLPYHAFNRGHVQLLFANAMPADAGTVTGLDRASVAANAAEALERAFNGAPTDPQVATELAMARLLAGDTTGARDMAQYVVTLTPDDPQAHLALGRALDASGDSAGAANAYLQAIALEGSTPRVDTRLALGEMSRRAGQVADALRWYEEAAALSPDDWAIAFNLGLLYTEIGDRDRAMTYLGRAIGMAPPAAQERIQEAMDAMLQDG